MDGFDDLQRLRNQRRATDLAASRSPGVSAAGSPSLLVRIQSAGSYPTLANAYFYCQILNPISDAGVGAGADFPPAQNGGYITAYNLTGYLYDTDEGDVPMVATFVGDRWILIEAY